ncbi:MAG TPA: PQQ-dependent sugar dehydrogenase [Nitrososphaeraceae archaeon]|nr:PQQ-dependent sugar dehydrogenase [Nitrososphaeraceae archaeon]
MPSVFRETALSFIILVSLLTSPIGYNDVISYAQEEIEGVNASIGDEDEEPFIKDPNLGVELVSSGGLELPTSMAFLGPDDILVLEKEKGTVQRIVNGKSLPTPVLTVDVASQVERCMCGIAVSKSDSGTVYVFLYFTEAEDGSGGSSEPIGNRLYRYEWINNQLVNPILLLDLPATPGPRHNGGVVRIGPDNNVYVIIGDVDGHETLAQNQESGEEADGTSGILRITHDGKPVGSSILGDYYPLNLYYAYGIRNSFGFDFDPITGNIWDTENGPGYGDEINLVEAGFNSGWLEITGFPSSSSASSSNDGFDPEDDDLVSFDGKGKYSNPEFEWTVTLGPTAVKFLNSDKLGAEYVNDMFVSDVVIGRIYHFDLNEDRTELVLEGPLADKVAETRDTGIEDIVFAEGFGGITDLEVGPDGYLYVVSLGHGAVYRILPAADVVSTPDVEADVEEEDNEDIEAVEEEEEEEDNDEE